MSPVGLEPAIPANEWLQTHNLGCTATGIDTTEINTLHGIIVGKQRASHYDVCSNV